MAVDKKIQRIRERIIKYLATQHKKVPAKKIADNISGRNKTIYEALSLLVTEGHLEMSGDGVKGEPYCYSLAARKIEMPNRMLIPALKNGEIKADSGPKFEEFIV